MKRLGIMRNIKPESLKVFIAELKGKGKRSKENEFEKKNKVQPVGLKI